jgi:hypothetical protein
MNETATYQRWSNTETWIAWQWLSDDQSCGALVDEARRYSDDVYDRADWIEQQLRRQLASEVDADSLGGTLLETALDRIVWYEAVERLL